MMNQEKTLNKRTPLCKLGVSKNYIDKMMQFGSRGNIKNTYLLDFFINGTEIISKMSNSGQTWLTKLLLT